MKLLKNKIIIAILYTVITSVVFIFLLEIAYRYQWFDTYKAEFNKLNNLNKIDKTKKTILICGDSFTANPISYVSVLRDSVPDYTILNAAVPGTCIRQHAVYLPGRIKEYKPEIFIYQFYAGNDLFEIRHPHQSPNISILRKIYWYLSDRLLSLSFLNFRFAGVRYQYFDDAGGKSSSKQIDTFSIENYSAREKFNYKVDPSFLEYTLQLTNGKEKDWQLFKKKFIDLVHLIPDTAPKYFILIPHESSLSISFREKHKKLGAVFNKPLTYNYPLWKEVKNMCDSLHITLVDFTQQPEDSILYENLYYTNDPHLSPSGQQILANKVLQLLSK